MEGELTEGSRARVAIFGLGYVGLVTAAAMASRGIRVAGYDVDAAKVEALRSGGTVIYEPGLEELLGRAREEGTISFTRDPVDAVRGSGFVFIAVGTPSREDGSMDPRYVDAAARDIGRAMRADPRYRVVVVKSTVIPGTTMGIVRSAIERESGMKCCGDFGLAMNPEFLREGKAVEDALRPDRIVIGEADRRSGDELEALWRSAVENDPPILRTTPENAELIKYANNSFLAMKVSFANMFARLCSRIPGCDIDTVMRGIGMDRRIGPEFLNAGMAWGGSCFPKDLRAISSFARGRGAALDLVEAALSMNSRGPREVAEILGEELEGLRGKSICVLGVSFKPDTDDTRESPALRLIGELRSRGVTVRACDPAARTNEVEVLRDPRECLRGADAAVLATEWAQFRGLRAEDFASSGVKLVLDTRRVYNPEEFRAAGVKLIQLGRGTA